MITKLGLIDEVILVDGEKFSQVIVPKRIWAS